MRLHASGLGVRAIAREIGRDPSTISRELKRGTGRGATGRRWPRPRPTRAGADHGRRSWRPTCGCAARSRTRLERRDSPEQIAGRLKIDFPDEPEMWVSPETIYQSLYVQARGGLKRELTAHLRTGPVDAQAAPPRGRAAGPDPGHGDDQRAPARGRGPGRARPLGGRPDHGVDGLQQRGRDPGRADHRVRDAAPPARRATARSRSKRRWSPRCSPCAEQLRRSLTWDQGREMTNHRQISRSHRPGHLLLRSALTLAARQRTRTPTACCASTCPRAPTCRSTAPACSTTSPPNSTHDPANDTASAPPPKSSTNYCPRPPKPTVLRDYLDSAGRRPGTWGHSRQGDRALAGTLRAIERALAGVQGLATVPSSARSTPPQCPQVPGRP